MVRGEVWKVPHRGSYAWFAWSYGDVAVVRTGGQLLACHAVTRSCDPLPRAGRGQGPAAVLGAGSAQLLMSSESSNETPTKTTTITTDQTSERTWAERPYRPGSSRCTAL